MVASHAALKETAATVALEMAEHMEMLAEAGEWDQIEDIAVRLRGVVMNVPESERRPVLQKVRQSTELVEARAMEARHEVTSKIYELRRGQAAKKAYELG